MNDIGIAPDSRDRLAATLQALQKMRGRVEAMEAARRMPIAVVGVGCRMPGGVTDAESYWSLLRDGRDTCGPVPSDRWDADALYDPDPEAPGRATVRHGSFLSDPVDGFDAGFFGLSPREAASIDPQQRLLLEVAWEALEHAGQPAARLRGSRTGVFIGVNGNDYALRLAADPNRINAWSGAANTNSAAAGRLSYLLGLNGPSMSLDTACSSALVALHLACRSLRTGESDMALAGGVNLLLSPEATIFLSKTRTLSPDGRCRTFDAAADGIGRGEGCGVVVLKRLPDALAAGDRVLAVVRGTAVNQDGASGGFSVPSGTAQEELLREAIADAGLSPADIDYVEAHGTGTPLGDAIELRALDAVLTPGRPAGERCWVGSVKTNIAHLEAAAGIAGLIKVVLALKQGEIPPHLHLSEPNPALDWRRSALAVPVEPTPWPIRESGIRRAGVSAFGMTGTNAHVVLESAPALADPSAPTSTVLAGGPTDALLPLSARSPEALAERAKAITALLQRAGVEGVPPLPDITWTASVGRDHHRHRLAVSGTAAQMAERLGAWVRGETRPGLASGTARTTPRRLVWVFSGHVGQWAALGRDLLEGEPAFRTALEACDRVLRAEGGPSPLDILSGAAGTGAATTLDVAQPTLFAVQIALAALWRSWGVEPSAVVGHSVGEVAAACVAGALDLEQAARLVCRRARLLEGLAGTGMMAVVELSLDEARDAIRFCGGSVSVAASNSPASTVLAGEPEALEALLDTLSARGVGVGLGLADVASHSAMMTSAAEELRAALDGLCPEPALVPIYSTVTGGPLPGEALTAGHWAANLREPVLFAPAVQALLADGHDAFLELSPHPVLLPDVADALHRAGRSGLVLPSLRRQEPERAVLLESLGALYTDGADPDWRAVQRTGRPVDLPLYPWQRLRHWLPEPKGERAAAPARPAPETGSRLIGRPVALFNEPGSHCFPLTLSADRLGWLADHRVGGAAVMPAAGFLTLALRAGGTLFGEADPVIERVALTEALVVPDGQERHCQLVLTADGADSLDLRIVSPPEDGGREWSGHAAATLRRRVGRSASAGERPDRIAARCTGSGSAEGFYAGMASRGIAFGPAFRTLATLAFGEGEVLARLEPRDTAEDEADRRTLVMDALLQALLALLARRAPGSYLPVAIERVEIGDAITGEALWAHASVRPDDDGGGGEGDDGPLGDAVLLDAEGRVVMALRGVRGRRIDPALDAVLHGPLNGWLYELEWRPRDADAAVPGAPPSGPWLILSDHGGTADRLAQGLTARGVACACCAPGADLSAALAGPLAGIVHCGALDASGGEPELSSLLAAQEAGTFDALRVVQSLAALPETKPRPRLWLMTRGLFAIADGDRADALGQAPLWGLGGTIQHEFPGLRATRIDLDPAAPAGEAEALSTLLLADGDADQMAMRGGRLYDVRLARRTIATTTVQTSPAPAGDADGAFRLEIAEPGLLERLTLRAVPRRAPGPGEVEIEVVHAGLNFADVLLALGVIPPDMAVPDVAGPQLGGECAGIVTAVGPGVVGFAVGDVVLAATGGSLASHVIAPAAALARKPAGLSFAEAAAIPCVFLTAYYAFGRIGNLRASERVLIHAATGGVGLAAIQFARRAGAEIIATAGSEEKRALLRSMGIACVLDSRSATFADGVMAHTRGEGVDVVLNCLAGELTQRGLELLRDGGRFLEIGKTDYAADRRLGRASFLRNRLYSRVDLMTIFRHRPDFAGEMLREVMALFEAGDLSPPPVQEFAAERAADAFRHMAQARHIGKIVLSMHTPSGVVLPARRRLSALAPDATYLITGGLGGIGLKLAAWMVGQGARHLVLVGRSGPKAEARSALAALESAGAEVRVELLDIAQPDAVTALLARLDREAPPLRGVIHCAGVLDDGVLTALDAGRFHRVLAPKLLGAWNLHCSTRDRRLDFFVLFSSISALLGSPGQGNYAAANACLDALAAHRRACGLPATNIRWGSWGDVGLAAAQENRADRLAAQGIAKMNAAEGCAILGRLLDAGAADVAVMGLDLARLAEAAPALRRSPLLKDLTAGAAVEAVASGRPVRSELADLSPAARPGWFADWLRRQIALVLRLAPEALAADVPLPAQGLDSLMGIELKNRLESSLGTIVPTARLRQATLGELARLLLDTPTPEAGAALPAFVARSEERHAPFPLTDVQHAYWVGRAAGFELGNVAAHVYLELDGQDLDLARLESAVERLVARHEMLRAVVLPDGTQRILPTVPPYRIRRHDARGETPDAVLAELRTRLSHERRPTDVWPLFDIQACALPGGVTRLFFSFDLVAFDAASLFLVFNDLGGFYRDPAAPPEPPPVSFRDYVLTLKSMESGEACRRALAYWRERLPTLPSAPALPLARDPSSVARPVFARRTAVLPRDRWSTLKARAAGFGLTPSETLLTAFADVLGRWSASPRLTLNLTLFNRVPLADGLDDVVGDFTTLTLLAVEADGRDFLARARQLQHRLWADLDHNAVGGVRVLRELAQTGGGPALMPVVFTSLLPLGTGGRGMGMNDAARRLGEPVYTIAQTPQVYLDHQVLEEDGRLVLHWDAVEELFPDGMLDSMLHAYTDLLTGLADGEQRWIARAPVALPPDQAARRADVNDTAANLPGGLLHDGFTARAMERPDAVAVVASGRRLLYGELYGRATRLGRELRDNGVRPNQLVAVVMEKGWEQVVAVLGVLYAGGAYLPVDADLPAERLRQVLEIGEVRIALTQSWVEDRIGWPDGIARIAVDRAEPGQAGTPPVPAQRPEDLAYVIFTSGSTGVPKGVMIDHRGALNTVADCNARFAVGAGDRVLALSSLAFDLSVYDIFGLLAAGGAVVLPRAGGERDPAHWVTLMNAESVSVWNTVPALMSMLLEYAEGRPAGLVPSLRLVMMSGDWIPLETPARIRASLASDPAIYSLGGATEASIWSILHPVGAVDPAWKSIPYGRPMLNQTFHVLDAALEPCPDWVSGRLYIGGLGLALGYWRDTERTAASFIRHPVTGDRLYNTGDLGRYRPDGTIEFLGRDDLQVKVRGYRIELADIDAHLVRHPSVQAAATVAVGDTVETRRLVTCVVPQPDARPDGAAIAAWLAERLPRYMVPSAILVRPALPLSGNGKIDRKAIAALALAGAAVESGDDAPVTDSERLVAGLWDEVLGSGPPARRLDFFAAGGDSLSAIRLIAAIRRRTGTELPLHDLLTARTVEGIAAALDGRRNAAPPGLPAVVARPEARFEPFPLTDLQQAYLLGRTDLFELGNVSAHSYLELDDRAFDRDRLEEAWRRVIDRHDMLRCVVTADGMQLVLPDVPPYRVEVLDLSSWEPAARDAALLNRREAMSHQVLRIDRWPAFDVKATLLAPGHARLHVSLDLLIADARSVQIVLGEVIAFYRRPDFSPPPVALTFRDYLEALARTQDTPEYERSLAYWRERIPDLPPAPSLPLARDPATIRHPRFRRLAAAVEPAAWSALRDAARAAGLTPSALLLAAFAEALSAWSADPGMTLNLTFFNRLPLAEGVQDVVGDFTTVSLLAVDGEGGDFRARAAALQRRLWADLDHSLVGGLRVMRELAQLRDLGASPVAPVVFTSLLPLGGDGAAQAPTIAELGDLVHAVAQTPQVWLDHQALEDAGSLILQWDVVDGLFPDGMVEAMFDAYTGLLARLVVDGQAWSDPTPIRRRERLPCRDGVPVAGPSQAVPDDAVIAALQRHPDVAAAMSADDRGMGTVCVVLRTEPSAQAEEPPPRGRLLTDPDERKRFKAAGHGVRHEPALPGIALTPPEASETLRALYRRRRTHRAFAPGAVGVGTLGNLLARLAPMADTGCGEAKRLYPSADGLYPVQTYVHVEPGRVEGLEGGLYYHHPACHWLVPLVPGAALPPNLHGLSNARIARQAAFTLFLIGRLSAITPMYGDLAREFAVFEAGSICQLLMTEAFGEGLGLCPIGHLEFDGIRHLFALDEEDVFLHALLGGPLDEDERSARPAGRWAFPQAALADWLDTEAPGAPPPERIVFLPGSPGNGMEAMPAPLAAAVHARVSAPADEPPPVAAPLARAVPAVSRDEIERELASILRAVLKREADIDANQNFFDIGVQSIQMVQLQNRLIDRFGEIPITDLFRHTTIASLAAYLAADREDAGRGGGPADESARRAQARLAARRDRQR